MSMTCNEFRIEQKYRCSKLTMKWMGLMDLVATLSSSSPSPFLCSRVWFSRLMFLFQSFSNESPSCLWLTAKMVRFVAIRNCVEEISYQNRNHLILNGKFVQLSVFGAFFLNHLLFFHILITSNWPIKNVVYITLSQPIPKFCIFSILIRQLKVWVRRINEKKRRYHDLKKNTGKWFHYAWRDEWRKKNTSKMKSHRNLQNIAFEFETKTSQWKNQNQFVSFNIQRTIECFVCSYTFIFKWMWIGMISLI